MDVFYNPIMVSNRNISITLLNSILNKDMNIALPLAGSGIRGVRFLKELSKEKINHIFFNDKKENFNKTLTKNFKTNNIKTKKTTITNEEASLFLLNQINSKTKPKSFCGYFDYIDLDPFGSPNPFLSAAIARISRKGIIAVTATDTAALSGTYENVTKRKYWATPLRNHLMHEIGIRILIRKIQLLGAQFEKALTPILSYHKDHYVRIYLRSDSGKTKCDNLLKQHQYFLYNSKTSEFKTSPSNNEKNFNQVAGPLWVGKLFDSKLLKTMVKNNTFPEEQKFLEALQKESTLNLPGFYDLHVISKKHYIACPKLDVPTKNLRGVRTHFSLNGIKTKKSIKEVIRILKGK